MARCGAALRGTVHFELNFIFQMRIVVKAKTRAKVASLTKVGERDFIIAVKEPPIEGRANSAIYRALADYFKVPLSQIKLVSGAGYREKIFDIM